MKDTLIELYKTIEQRKASGEQNSYTRYLFEAGLDKILKKCGEETAELIIAAKNDSKEEVIAETCDLFYHIFVLLNVCGVSFEDIEAELNKRSLKSGNLKERKQTNKNS
jgi:phosphoribosyl-ATP pyrophosphohydrolase